MRAWPASMLAVAASAASLSCAPSSGSDGPVIAYVLGRIEFAPTVDGVSEGIDLDGRVSDMTDAESCGKVDYTSPEGVAGIDNQLAIAFGLLDQLSEDDVVGALRGLIGDAIRAGMLLVMVEAAGVDDLERDRSVEVRVFRGVGVPGLDPESHLLPYQTFDVDPNAGYAVTTDARVEDGVLTAGPFELRLPISILDVSFEMTVRDAQLRLHLTPDGWATGAMGGGIELTDIQALIEEAVSEGADPGIASAAMFLPSFADLNKPEEGRCTRISVALSIDATPAFVYADAVRPEP